jgi:hypothetical protein
MSPHVASIPQRTLTWLTALAAAAGEHGWATSAEVVEALRRSTPGTTRVTPSAAGANLRSLHTAGLVESRPWNYRREWKLTRAGWAFVTSD